MASTYERAEKFEKQLSGAFTRAFLAALVHKCTAWVGAATLTWATVVLMGGFAANVSISDFVQVTYLVLIIAFLLGLALLTGKLVTKKNIYTGSLHPAHLSYQDKRLRFITIIQLISCLVQSLLISLCLSIAWPSIHRPHFKDIHMLSLLNPHFKPKSAVNILPADFNLQVCLYTFFLLVITTCILASLCLMYIVVEASLWHKSLSLKKYHDEVLSRSMNIGLVEADEFDVREFLLRGLGEDLVIRNIAPLEVKRQNAEFIKYLYNHPKGVEMVYEGLAAEDTVRQQTAANMPGFWAREEKMEKNTVLLCRLAEKLGLAGKTAEGAVNSFSALAVEWEGKCPSPLLRVDVSRDGGRPCINVVERVVDLVLERRTPTLQVYIRILDSFFMSESVVNWLASQRGEKLDEIKKKLMSIIQSTGSSQNTNAGETVARIEPSVRPRTRFLAFSALDRLNTSRTDINWPADAARLLKETLDVELMDQEFMWHEEAKRYRELCNQFFDGDHQLGAWLPPTGKCVIRGSEFANMA